MKKTFIAAFVAICLISSCSSGSREFIVADIDAPTGTVDMKLSDLLSDIKIVPLETGEGTPLISDGGFRISGKYIVHYGVSAVHLFDSNGKYLRLLAVAGGGPNEFRSIYRLLIDDSRDVIYYSDSKSNTNIYRIDLLSGKHLEPLEVLLDGKSFSYVDLDNSGNIYGFFAEGAMNMFSSGASKDNEGDPYIAHRYNVENNTIEGIEAPAVFSSTGMNRSIAKREESIYIYDSSCADTLFSYSKGVLSPVMGIKMRDVLTDPMTGGYNLNIYLAGSNGLLFRHVYTKIDVVTDASGEISSISVRKPTGSYLFADKNSGELLTVRSLYIDPLGTTVDVEPVRVSGDYGFYLIDAYKIEDMIEESLAEDRLSAQERKSLESLTASITEDSNPVIITGKIR